MLSRLGEKFPNLSGRFIFLLFSGVIFFNLFVLVGLTYYINQSENFAEKDKLINIVVNSIALLEKAQDPEKERIAIVSQAESLSVTVTSMPMYPLQIKNDYLNNVTHAIQQSKHHLAMSIKLDQNNWVNFEYNGAQHLLILQITIIFLETIVAVILLFCAWYVERFQGPLKKFKQVAEGLGVDVNAQPLVAYGPSIVKETAHAMNQMQQRITDLLQDRNLMLAAISHDLRTPITRMKIRSQLIHDQQDCQEMLSDLDEMEKMISQILAYAKDAALQEKRIKFDLVSLILSICDDLSEQGSDVRCHIKTPLIAFEGCQIAIKRALTNLITNGAKYATQVEVTVAQQQDIMTISIDDNGPGIPESDLAKVFTPFYRVCQARTSTTGGTGLGLAIAYDVIRGHQGTISLHNRQQGGLRVLIQLRCQA